MKKEEYILKNWANDDLKTMQKKTNLDIYEILEIAYKNNLHKKTTNNLVIPSQKKVWTPEEDLFMKNHSLILSIDEVACLFRRSRRATFQRIKFLGITGMIQKRNGEKK